MRYMFSSYNVPPPNPRYLVSWNHKQQAATSLSNGVTNQAWLSSILVDYPCTIDQMTMNISTGSAATNIRLGLYKPLVTTPFTPVGGSLVSQSGNISAATSGLKTWTITTPIRLDPGWYFGALLTADGTQAFRRATANAIYDDATAEFIKGSQFDNTAFGNLIDPCPAVTLENSASFVCLLRVSTWG